MSDKISPVPFKLPSMENARVFKGECIFCFQTPEHEGGLLVNVSSHLGFCPDHARYGLGPSPGYLHIKRTRRRMKKSDEPEQKITKLAIGVQGGLQETQFEFDEEYSFVEFPGRREYQLNDPQIDEKLRSCCDAMISCESANRLQELESLAGTWDGSYVVPTKHIDLHQLTPAPKISPTGWRCQVEGCDKMDNLWLNLTDGKILCGRKYHDGSGGNNHALEHFHRTGYPLAVKLGTITAQQADVFSYDEDEMVQDPKLEEHLLHFGINMQAMQKTDKSMLELELDLNTKFEFSRIQESGRNLVPVYGPGLTGMVNLGSSCYMNSALQTLAMVPDIRRIYGVDSAEKIFTSFIDSCEWHQVNGIKNPNDNLQVQFAKLFSGILSGKFSKEQLPKADDDTVSPENAVRPLTFRTLVGKNHPEFSSRRQQDVEEYFRWLFEKLEQQRDVGGNAVVESFQFETVGRLVCQATGRVVSERRPETILSLPVPVEKAINLAEVDEFEKRLNEAKAAGKKLDDVVLHKIPLRACLEAYMAPTIIENARSPFNESIITSLSKSQRLATFPDYLLVQLRKFTVANDWTPKKLEVEVLVDDYLNIEDLAVPSDQKDEPMDVGMPPKANAPDASVGVDVEVSVEEEAGLGQLIDAGFPLNACRKALQHGGGRIDDAFEWLLTHSGDPDFDSPAVPAATFGATVRREANEDSLVGLANMGFSRDQGRKALRLANGNFEGAIAWLLDNPADPGEPESTPVAQGRRRGSVGSAKYRNGRGEYRLVGFISHMGSSAHSGHYVCHLLKDVEGLGKRWVIFNDEKVALSEDPPKSLGYVYLYERDR